MKSSYYLVPVVLLALFGGLYWQHMGSMNKKIEAQKIEQAKVKAEEEAKKKEAERKAREDAEKRIAERDALERKKEEEKEAKRKAEIEKIKSDTDKYNGQLADAIKKSASLEKELSELRAQKDQLGRDAFEASKRVELALIDKRNAELQVQRMAEMVAKRANESSMSKLPVADMGSGTSK
jgi:membrane protein involved in colicin uptake